MTKINFCRLRHTKSDLSFGAQFLGFQATLFVILILPLALPGEESQKGLHSSIGQYIFSDPS